MTDHLEAALSEADAARMRAHLEGCEGLQAVPGSGWPPVRPTAAKHAGRGSAPFLAHTGDVLDQRRELARAQGALSRAERRFLPRGPWATMVGPEAAGLLPNAAAKVGDRGSRVFPALAKQDD
jgi:hypothetical protein